jgi:hypothetical protein
MSERRPLAPEVLRGILGPAGPELTCEECFARLDVYVERERAGVDADVVVPGMRAHLQGCPACDEDHASLLALLGAEDRGGA